MIVRNVISDWKVTSFFYCSLLLDGVSEMSLSLSFSGKDGSSSSSQNPGTLVDLTTKNVNATRNISTKKCVNQHNLGSLLMHFFSSKNSLEFPGATTHKWYTVFYYFEKQSETAPKSLMSPINCIPLISLFTLGTKLGKLGFLCNATLG